jgi:hypothetical protein
VASLSGPITHQSSSPVLPQSTLSASGHPKWDKILTWSLAAHAACLACALQHLTDDLHSCHSIIQSISLSAVHQSISLSVCQHVLSVIPFNSIIHSLIHSIVQSIDQWFWQRHPHQVSSATSFLEHGAIVSQSVNLSVYRSVVLSIYLSANL